MTTFGQFLKTWAVPAIGAAVLVVLASHLIPALWGGMLAIQTISDSINLAGSLK